MQTKRLQIYGVVQGVGFRYSICDKANQQNLTGYVKNCPDGSVEVVVQGADDEVKNIIDWIEEGPGMAQVERLEVEDAAGQFKDFEIRY